MPHVNDKVKSIMKRLKAVANHTRVLSISALQGKNVKELMRRCLAFIEAMKEDDGIDPLEEETVCWDDPNSDESLSLVRLLHIALCTFIPSHTH